MVVALRNVKNHSYVVEVPTKSLEITTLQLWQGLVNSETIKK